MNNITSIVWMSLFIAAIITEAATVNLVAIWFMPGAIASLICSFITDSLLIQGIVFVVVSVACLVFLRKPLKKLLFNKPFVPTNSDRYISMTAIVSEEICNDEARGEVKIFSETWSARSVDGSVIPPDTKVRVERIEGVKLICSVI